MSNEPASPAGLAAGAGAGAAAQLGPRWAAGEAAGCPRGGRPARRQQHASSSTPASSKHAGSTPAAAHCCWPWRRRRPPRRRGPWSPCTPPARRRRRAARRCRRTSAPGGAPRQRIGPSSRLGRLQGRRRGRTGGGRLALGRLGGRGGGGRGRGRGRGGREGEGCARTLQLAPHGQVGDGGVVADQVGAQRQEVVDAGARRLQAQAGHDRGRKVQPGVDLSRGRGSGSGRQQRDAFAAAAAARRGQGAEATGRGRGARQGRAGRAPLLGLRVRWRTWEADSASWP
jgi:hypothetical protein